MADQRFWTLPEGERIFQLMTDMGDGTHAIRMEAYPPKKLLTDGDGDYARHRVDVGQTSFFAGREFRFFYEFDIPSGQTIYLKFDNSLVEVIMQHLNVSAWAGNVRVELIREGTETTPFTTPIPIFRTNGMSSAELTYLTQVSASLGGVITDGELREVTELDAGQGSSRHHEFSEADIPYGLALGEFYIKISALGAQAARGAFRARWEERPSGY